MGVRMTLQRWLTSFLILPAVLILSTHPSQATLFQLALGCHTVRVPQSTSYTYTRLLVSPSRLPYTYLIGTYSSVPATCRLWQLIVLKPALSCECTYCTTQFLLSLLVCCYPTAHWTSRAQVLIPVVHRRLRDVSLFLTLNEQQF